MISRRRTREYLLQLLYARVGVSPQFDRDIFVSAYFADMDQSYVDTPYVDAMESLILEHESELMSIITVLAPKFDLPTMPTLHILILMIALTESLYFRLEEIPLSVSINEAIELAKRFSDEPGKIFVNGALATFATKKETTLLAKIETPFHIFSR